MHKYPESIIPPLPAKSLKEKIATDDSNFVSKRKHLLELFLHRVAEHPLLGQTPDFIDFLHQKYFLKEDS